MSKPIVVIACMLSSSESWEPQTAPTSLALTCRWRSRPQHHKRTYASQQLASLFNARIAYVDRMKVCATRWRHGLDRAEHARPRRRAGLAKHRYARSNRNFNYIRLRSFVLTGAPASRRSATCQSFLDRALPAAFRIERAECQEFRHARARIIGGLERWPRLQPRVPFGDARISALPDMGEAEVGHPVDARHHQHVGQRELRAHDPRALLGDGLVHAPARLAQLLQRTIDLRFAEAARRAHALEQLLAHLADLDLLFLELLLIELVEAVEEGPVE